MIYRKVVRVNLKSFHYKGKEMFASLFSFGSMLLGLGQTGYSKRRKKESQRKIGLMLGK